MTFIAKTYPVTDCFNFHYKISGKSADEDLGPVNGGIAAAIGLLPYKKPVLPR